jgi:hypothetical protein
MLVAGSTRLPLMMVGQRCLAAAASAVQTVQHFASLQALHLLPPLFLML